MNDTLTFLTTAGAIAVIIAAIAWFGDWRRFRRKNIDRVGFMPWTPIFFVSLIAALSLLGVAAKSWLGG